MELRAGDLKKIKWVSSGNQILRGGGEASISCPVEPPNGSCSSEQFMCTSDFLFLCSRKKKGGLEVIRPRRMMEMRAD